MCVTVHIDPMIHCVFNDYNTEGKMSGARFRKSEQTVQYENS